MSKKASTPQSFDAALSELETLVAAMESGQLSIEDALDAYQKGAGLLKFCQERLAGIEQKVQVLEEGVLRDLSGPAESDSDAS